MSALVCQYMKRNLTRDSAVITQDPNLHQGNEVKVNQARAELISAFIIKTGAC